MFHLSPYMVEVTSEYPHAYNVCNRGQVTVILKADPPVNMVILHSASDYLSQPPGKPHTPSSPIPVKRGQRGDIDTFMNDFSWNRLRRFEELFTFELVEEGGDVSVPQGLVVSSMKVSAPGSEFFAVQFKISALSSQYLSPFYIRMGLVVEGGDRLIPPVSLGPFCVTSRPLAIDASPPYKKITPPIVIKPKKAKVEKRRDYPLRSQRSAPVPIPTPASRRLEEDTRPKRMEKMIRDLHKTVQSVNDERMEDVDTLRAEMMDIRGMLERILILLDRDDKENRPPCPVTHHPSYGMGLTPPDSVMDELFPCSMPQQSLFSSPGPIRTPNWLSPNKASSGWAT
jgi:hypothetical protein